MKKNNYYVETSDSEVDLNNRLRYAIILMVWRSVFTVKMKKKTRKLKMAIETVRKKRKKKKPKLGHISRKLDPKELLQERQQIVLIFQL